MPTRRPSLTLVAIALTSIGFAMLVTGIAMTVWRWTHSTESFGWFAYAPLSDSTFAPGPGTAVVVSYVLTAVGGVVAGLGAGILSTIASTWRRDASTD